MPLAATVANATIASMTYTTEQIFNRKALGSMRACRNRFEPGQIKLLDSLSKNKKRGTVDGVATVTYRLANSTPGRLGYGRLFGTLGSLEQFERSIRGSLCAEFYTDIDIVNCHCVLIPQLAKRTLDMDMPFLEQYNGVRAEVLAQVVQIYGITAEDAKEMICSVLYAGKRPEHGPQLLCDMYDEIRSFTQALIKSKQHDKLYQYIKSLQKNTYGAFLSWVVQSEERKCLVAMIDYLTAAGLRVDVLAYDGCMTRGTDNVTDDILRGCEEAVYDATNYRVQLKVKEMVSLDDLEDAAAAEEKTRDEAYSEMKADWEREHFYFKPTGCIVEMKDGRLCHYKIEHAMEAFNMWQLKNEDGKPESFLKRWREDGERRIVDRLVYKLPENCAANECTLFGGYAYQRLEGAKWSDEAVAAFKDILMAVCGDNVQVFEYEMDTMAHMIQKPFEKTGVCTIFVSRAQGTGKDTVMGWKMKVMGNHIAHYTSDDIFWDKHDTRKEGAVMMYLEEAGMGNRARENALKARITSDDIEIRPCGVPAYTVPNIARYFMTTNEVNPVKIDETDRRFMITNCSDRLRTNHAFWDKVHGNLTNNPDWIYTIGKMLEERDISAFHPRRMPVTAYKEAIQEAAVDSEKAFLQQWVGNETSGADLFIDYRNFCSARSLPHALNLKSFGTRIIPFISQLCSKKRITSGVVYYKNEAQKAATVPAEPVGGPFDDVEVPVVE